MLGRSITRASATSIQREAARASLRHAARLADGYGISVCVLDEREAVGIWREQRQHEARTVPLGNLLFIGGTNARGPYLGYLYLTRALFAVRSRGEISDKHLYVADLMHYATRAIVNAHRAPGLQIALIEQRGGRLIHDIWPAPPADYYLLQAVS